MTKTFTTPDLSNLYTVPDYLIARLIKPHYNDMDYEKVAMVLLEIETGGSYIDYNNPHLKRYYSDLMVHNAMLRLKVEALITLNDLQGFVYGEEVYTFPKIGAWNSNFGGVRLVFPEQFVTACSDVSDESLNRRMKDFGHDVAIRKEMVSAPTMGVLQGIGESKEKEFYIPLANIVNHRKFDLKFLGKNKKTLRVNDLKRTETWFEDTDEDIQE